MCISSYDWNSYRYLSTCNNVNITNIFWCFGYWSNSNITRMVSNSCISWSYIFFNFNVNNMFYIFWSISFNKLFILFKIFYRYCRGVIGVVDVPSIILEPTHNKQSFADEKEYHFLLRNIGEYMRQYWTDTGIENHVKEFWETYGII